VTSRTVLVALEPFEGGLGSERAAAALARGLQAGDRTLEIDVCPLDACASDPGTTAERLAAAGFDARMRAARAVIVGAGRLDEATLLGSATFEVATRARQAGVPTYAVAAVDALSPFDARILDLQVVLRAGSVRALRRAGERLAELV
jgi:glycerate kinase